jgi:hypothetical protein
MQAAGEHVETATEAEEVRRQAKLRAFDSGCSSEALETRKRDSDVTWMIR